MKKIFLSNKDIKELEVIGMGAEGVIYKYNFEGDTIAIKIFNPDIFTSNKLEKIKLIHSKEIDKVITKPQCLVCVDGKINGYAMEYDQNDQNLESLNELTVSEKLEYLKTLRNIIELLHKHNIVVGDLKLSNILVNEGTMKICDVDNFKVDDLDPDILNLYSKQYFRKYKKMDEGLDVFSFNILTILFLINDSRDELINYIMKGSYTRNEELRNIFERLLNDKEYTESYIIDDPGKLKRKTIEF